jgi:hypothetical protein
VYLQTGCFQLIILLQLLRIVKPELHDVLYTGSSAQWSEMLKKSGLHVLKLVQSKLRGKSKANLRRL